jgi:DNA-directed RNA polymerase subunit M/transcription elongation factor TFIIS
MKFCLKCDNMYYIGIGVDDPNKIIYYCRNCKYRDETLSEDGVCVLNTQLKKGEQHFNHIINKYTKLDPTLPRIYNIQCPNKECESNNGEKSSEIIYLRYDDDNLKYLYICSYCDTVWKTVDKT